MQANRFFYWEARNAMYNWWQVCPTNLLVLSRNIKFNFNILIRHSIPFDNIVVFIGECNYRA